MFEVFQLNRNKNIIQIFVKDKNIKSYVVVYEILEIYA